MYDMSNTKFVNVGNLTVSSSSDAFLQTAIADISEERTIRQSGTGSA